MKFKYNNEKEMHDAFVAAGWAENTSFTRLAQNDFETIGLRNIDIETPLYYMDNTGSGPLKGNIYDGDGNLVMYNLHTISYNRREEETIESQYDDETFEEIEFIE